MIGQEEEATKTPVAQMVETAHATTGAWVRHQRKLQGSKISNYLSKSWKIMSISLEENCDLEEGFQQDNNPKHPAKAALQLFCREEWRKSAEPTCAILTETHPHRLGAVMGAKGGLTKYRAWLLVQSQTPAYMWK